jgi:hypothetical protein
VGPADEKTEADSSKMTTEATKVAPTGAARMRLHRWRRRKGIRRLTISLADPEIDALIRRGLLTEEQRDDPEMLENALDEFFLIAL